MKDLFSKQAASYAAFRPTYPKELYDFILSHVRERRTAWDCGTGNGQVARDLAQHFKDVYATDLSASQIASATSAPNVKYSVSSADKTGFPDSTFDLITVGQAIHWFNFPEFYKEVIRVSKPGALLAVWGYSLLTVRPEIDEIMNDFYANIIGPYWDAERKLIDEHYKTIPFPFEEIQCPEFAFSFGWKLDQFQGYLTTWSSVQKYMKEREENPVEALIERIRPIWNAEKFVVSFPLFLRIGRVVK